MTAADILVLVAKLNLAAAAAVVLVLALRPLTRRGLGARITYALWLLPPVAMLGALIPPRQEVITLAPMVAQTSAHPIPQAAQAASNLAAAPLAPLFDPISLVLALWLAGFLVAALAKVHAQRRFLAEARKGDIGPAVIGVISPRIITPADFTDRFDAQEQALVLEHEQVHIRRQDLRLNALTVAVQCLFWFNPLIHLAARFMRIDQELACDEAVVSRFPSARNAYARALVKSQLANRPLPLGCYWPSGTQHPFLERIAMLKTAHTGAKTRVAGAAALTALCAISAVGAWAAIPAERIYKTTPVPPAPAIEIAAAPQAPAAQPEARPRTAPLAPAPVEDICLTNACSNGVPIVDESQQVATCEPTPCRVEKIGRKLIPSGVAFARYFDGNAPVMLKGRVIDMKLRDDGIASEFLVEHIENGQPIRWRVMGGTAANMPPEVRAVWEQAVGQEVVVRGYQTHDKSCEGACILNGRDVTRTDGTRFAPRGPALPAGVPEAR